MKYALSLALIIVAATPQTFRAVEKHKAAYAGGTIARLNAAGRPVDGRIDTVSPQHLTFVADEHPGATITLRVAYAAIHHLEFGQKARRRVTTATSAAALLGPMGLVALRSKHRAHYLTVAYTDDLGSNQVIVLELGKAIVRDTLAVIEARSGKALEYQDEEARKWR